MTQAQNLVPATKAVDHLLLGVPDLDRGISWVYQKTGVKAVVGGSHPGRGTRNALLSLGGRQYLEIIAPDPAQTTFGFQIDLRKLPAPRLVNWAAVSMDLDALATRATAAGQRVMMLGIVGIGVGLAGALALSRALTALVYGISLRDPVTYIVVAGTLGFVALAACSIPAIRASRVDPMVALRSE